MIIKLRQLAREPLIHFLLIGGMIYGAYALYGASDDTDDERKITITTGEIEALSNQWVRMWNRPPTNEEFSNIIRQYVREQILYREAVAMGLDDGDIVIRRRLAQKLELLAQGLITPEEPTDEALQTWYEENENQYKQPDRYTLTHIFFNPDKREESTLDDANEALAELRALEAVPASFDDYGDRFMLQNYYPERTELELRKLFGTGFVESVIAIEPDKWHGPVLSGYGTHLVYVNNVWHAPDVNFDEARETLKQDWMAAQTEELSERFIDNLVSRYEVIVEDAEVPLITPPSGGAP